MMKNPLLAKLSHFVRLSGDEKAELDQLSTEHPRRFGAREDIVREGEKPTHIRLVLEGWACRYKVLEDGRRQIIAFFLPGDMCDLNVFVLRQMDHSIAAITPVLVSDITQPAFEELMLSRPRISQGLWWESLVAAAIQREWAVSLGQRDAFERLAHLFCELFLRLEAVGLTDGDSCEIPLTQVELGEAMGMSSVHINRTLQQLRASNLIVLRDKTLTIPDMDGLRRAGLFNANYLHLDREGRHLDANDGSGTRAS